MHVLLTKSKHRSQEQLMCEKGKPSGSIACMEKNSSLGFIEAGNQ